MEKVIGEKVIGGERFRVIKVTGDIARILTGRNSYLCYKKTSNPQRKEIDEVNWR